MPQSRFKIFLTGWVVAWVIAIFLPSAVIAALGQSDAAATMGPAFQNLPGSFWRVADDVSPAAKLMIGGILLGALLALGRAPLRQRSAVILTGAAGGVLAMATTMAFLPVEHSRGFAAGLSGVRFEPLLTAIYLTGGAAAGAIGALLSRRA